MDGRHAQLLRRREVERQVVHEHAAAGGEADRLRAQLVDARGGLANSDFAGQHDAGAKAARPATRAGGTLFLAGERRREKALQPLRLQYRDECVGGGARGGRVPAGRRQVEAARQRLTELESDPAWGKRLTSGDLAARREWQQLTTLIAGVAA